MTMLSLFESLRSYVEVSALLALGYVSFAAFLAVAGGEGSQPSRWVRVGYFVMVCAVAFPLLGRGIPKTELFHPAAQVWGGAPKVGAMAYALIAPAHSVVDESTRALAGVRLGGWALAGLGLALALGALFFLGRLLIQLWSLHRSLSALPLIRKIGRVRIYASDEDPVAFSAWLPGRAAVVVPTPLISSRRDFAIALRHELHHHRRGDTRWLYLNEILKAAFFWNPAAHAFSRVLGELQEFACDEFLIGHRKIPAREYGSCLLRAAESAVGTRSMRVGTTGMAAVADCSCLRRRMTMILNHLNGPRRRSLGAVWLLLFAVGTVIAMASVAFASRSAIQDRVVTMAEARAAAESVRKLAGATIPLDVNELVLAKLNYFVGTPEGRRYVQNGLTRMAQYKQLIASKTGSYGLPDELISIALYESDFLNDVVSPPPHLAAGIWQFIPQTARRYGLTVTSSLDERVDPEKETDAAMRYFRDLNNEFQDWRLAIKAYNEGESKVEQTIAELGTRDPWAIENAESTEHYLPGAIAMMLIMRDPRLME